MDDRAVPRRLRCSPERRPAGAFPLPLHTLRWSARCAATPDGIVVPITVLAKERLRAFDLRDEAGNALPGPEEHRTASSACRPAQGSARCARPRSRMTSLSGSSPTCAGSSMSLPRAPRACAPTSRERPASPGRTTRPSTGSTCRALLDVMWTNYVLFAVIAEGGPNRRVLKDGYTETQPIWLPRRVEGDRSDPVRSHGASGSGPQVVSSRVPRSVACPESSRRDRRAGGGSHRVCGAERL